jgi:hypothetical protein
MAHKVIGDKVIVDWTTGDPEGDRVTLLAAYRDFIKELQQVAIACWNDEVHGIKEVFDKWSINTEDQIDEVPRIWIKRPNAG